MHRVTPLRGDVQRAVPRWRVQARSFRLARVGATHRDPRLRPLAERANAKVTVAASLAVKLNVVPPVVRCAAGRRQVAVDWASLEIESGAGAGVDVDAAVIAGGAVEGNGGGVTLVRVGGGGLAITLNFTLALADCPSVSTAVTPSS